MKDSLERPALGWWIAIGGGIGCLAIVALSDSAYAWWSTHITAAIPQWAFRGLFYGTVLTHIAEALSAWQLARRSGLNRSASAWAAQTFILGFPSLRLLRAKVSRA